MRGPRRSKSPPQLPKLQTLLQNCYLDLPHQTHPIIFFERLTTIPEKNIRGGKSTERDRKLRRMSGAASELSSHQGRNERTTSVRTKIPRRCSRGLHCVSRATEPRCATHQWRSARGSPLESGASVVGAHERPEKCMTTENKVGQKNTRANLVR